MTVTAVLGECSVDYPGRTLEMAYKVSVVRDAAAPFDIDVLYRGGAWKPRTKYHSNGERVYEGTRENGLIWLGKVADQFSLPMVTECMSEDDLRHFGRYLEPERDSMQIGARNDQNFALLYAIGGTQFGSLLKNPQHGVNPKEAEGSLQRLLKNRIRMYCTRGQHPFIHPDGVEDEAFRTYVAQLRDSETQDPESRNLNNIGAISQLRDHPYFTGNGILLIHDPSHTWGGKNDRIRRKIGENAIKAVTQYGYDGIELDVNDRSASARVDGDQALLTTTKNVDWAQTNGGQGLGVKPGEGREPEIMPFTVVDIMSELISYQAQRFIDEGHMTSDEAGLAKAVAMGKLSQLSWDLRY